MSVCTLQSLLQGFACAEMVYYYGKQVYQTNYVVMQNMTVAIKEYLC